MTHLEAVVTAHLEESGAIRSDLAWLKKAMFALIGAGMTFNVSLAIALITYLLRR